jgi:phosphate transport system substrate-binding protein
MTRKQLACSIFSAALTIGGSALTISVANAKTNPPPIATIYGGGSSLAYPTYIAEYALFGGTKDKVVFSYPAAGSGAGQNGFLGNNPDYFNPINASTNTIGYKSGTLTYGPAIGTTVDFGASDAALTASQLSNPATGSYPAANKIPEPGTSTSTGSPTFIPAGSISAVDGPVIQIPTFGTPVTMAYNESGVTPAPNYTAGTGGLVLTDAQICGIFSGKITDWNLIDSAIPSGTNINVVYRSDSSGTTFLLTQHLDAVCNSSNSNFAASVLTAPTKTFATLFATVPSSFTGESGSANVQGELMATTNSIGYLSPDYTDIAPGSLNSPKNAGFTAPAGFTIPAGTTLPVAAVVNPLAGSGSTAFFPTVANLTNGLLNPLESDSFAELPPATKDNASDPLNWIPLVPQTTEGYSIVGYTTLDLSTCYSATNSPNVAAQLIKYLKDIYKSSGPYYTIITNNGFVPLPNTKAAPFVKAIQSDFLSNKSLYNLDINDTTVCGSIAGR